MNRVSLIDMQRIICLFLFVFSFIFFLYHNVQNVGAHSFGPSFEKVVGEYLFDIGYESDPVVAGESTTFTLELYEEESMLPVEFHDIWVRIERGERTIFATGIAPGFNFQPTMIYTFPEAGDHTLYIKFQGEDFEEIAEASFPLTVVEGKRELNILLPVVALIAFVAGGAVISGISMTLKKNRKSLSSQKSDKKQE